MYRTHRGQEKWCKAVSEQNSRDKKSSRGRYGFIRWEDDIKMAETSNSGQTTVETVGGGPFQQAHLE